MVFYLFSNKSKKTQFRNIKKSNNHKNQKYNYSDNYSNSFSICITKSRESTKSKNNSNSQDNQLYKANWKSHNRKSYSRKESFFYMLWKHHFHQIWVGTKILHQLYSFLKISQIFGQNFIFRLVFLWIWLIMIS